MQCWCSRLWDALRPLMLLVALASPAGATAVPVPQALKTSETLRGQFTQERVLAGFSKPLNSKGSFVLVPRQGLIWRSEEPFRSTVVITSAGMFQLVEGQEAMRVEASRVPGLNELYFALEAAVSGNVDGLQKTFAVTRSGDARSWTMVLVPHRSGFLKSLTLVGSKFVERVDVDKGGGDVDHLAFSDQTITSAALSDDEVSLLGRLSK